MSEPQPSGWNLQTPGGACVCCVSLPSRLQPVGPARALSGAWVSAGHLHPLLLAPQPPPTFPRGPAKKSAPGGGSGRCRARPAGGRGGEAAAGGPAGRGCRAFMPALRGTLPWGFCFPVSAPFLLGLLSKPCDAMWDVMTQVQTQPVQGACHSAPLGFATLPLGSLP